MLIEAAMFKMMGVPIRQTRWRSSQEVEMALLLNIAPSVFNFNFLKVCTCIT